MKTDLLFRYRVLVVLAHAATVFLTWPLWTAHALPPMLPALPLPAQIVVSIRAPKTVGVRP